MDELLDEFLDDYVYLPAEIARLGICGNIKFINEVPVERWYLDDNGALKIERAIKHNPYFKIVKHDEGDDD